MLPIAAAAVAALASTVVAASGSGAAGVGTYFCDFVFNSVTCPTSGPCCLNSSAVDSGSRAGDSTYNLAFCKITSG